MRATELSRFASVFLVVKWTVGGATWGGATIMAVGDHASPSLSPGWSVVRPVPWLYFPSKNVAVRLRSVQVYGICPSPPAFRILRQETGWCLLFWSGGRILQAFLFVIALSNQFG